MMIYDYSPCKPNTSNKDNRVAIFANTPTQYRKAVEFFRYFFKADFVCGNDDFKTAKKYLPKNSKVILTCYYNDMTGKYEIHYTNKSIIKHNRFFKYDFIGNLTDYAQTI